MEPLAASLNSSNIGMHHVFCSQAQTVSDLTSSIHRCQRIDVITHHEWIYTICTCDCHKSEFADLHHTHVVTSDLNVTQNKSLGELLGKGPTYREEQKRHWKSI